MINAARAMGRRSVCVESDPEAYTPVVIKTLQDPAKWRESMRADRGALHKRGGCWKIVKIPLAVTLAMYTNWRKTEPKKLVKWKSRLVILGCNQVEGLDYKETFAPVIKTTTFLLMVTLAKLLKLYLHQLDVCSSFLYVDMDEIIWMQLTPNIDI